MEDGDTAKGAADPFAVVLLKFGVHRLEEGSNEGFLEGGTDNVSLLDQIADYGHKSCQQLSLSIV